MPALKISPKVAAWAGLATTIMLYIGAGTITLPLGIPHDWVDYIRSWCVFLGAINSTILTACAAWSAPISGPLAGPPSLTEAHQVMTEAKAATAKQ